MGMETVYERCCGLDIHKNSITACRRLGRAAELQTFGTRTKDLRELRDWILAGGCTHVAMESTGVFWKPVFNVLEGHGLTLWLVNARHIKQVPGRKTDMKDAEWIAQLLQHGLLRPSFVPDREQRELREVVRYRRSLVQELARETNRIQKVLEGANIKLAGTISDILGVAGRAVLQALVEGETDPEVLANAVTTNVRASHEQLVAALEGAVHPHQRHLLRMQLTHITFLGEQIAELDAEIERRLAADADVVDRLDEIPGVGRRGAEEILAALGTDLRRFPSARHLANWAQVAPGNNVSGGKQKSGKTPKSTNPLRTTLVEAARAAGRTKNSYLGAQYRRLAKRRGSNKAAVAVGHSILVIAYHLIKDGVRYADLGPGYFDERSKEQTIKRTVNQLERLLGRTIDLDHLTAA
jgi:transposase